MLTLFKILGVIEIIFQLKVHNSVPFQEVKVEGG